MVHFNRIETMCGSCGRSVGKNSVYFYSKTEKESYKMYSRFFLLCTDCSNEIGQVILQWDFVNYYSVTQSKNTNSHLRSWFNSSRILTN